MGARPAAPPARQDRGDPLTAADDDPYLRWQVPPDAVLERWDDPEGVALLQQGRQGVPVLTVVGTPATAVRLAPAALEAHDVHRTTLPRGAVEALDRHAPEAAARLHGGADWDWFWTASAPPAQPGEDAVVRLLDADDEVRDLLAVSSPRHSAVPGTPGIERWMGLRENGSGRLLACAANEPFRPGVPHLASVATHPDVRGRGLGAVVTAAITRGLLDDGFPVVTLGMYADNDVARRLYLRLGFTCAHEFTSRAVRPAA
ncbi:GNAT family N-acetyltransferase [Angustibacter speluncae]